MPKRRVGLCRTAVKNPENAHWQRGVERILPPIFSLTHRRPAIHNIDTRTRRQAAQPHRTQTQIKSRQQHDRVVVPACHIVHASASLTDGGARPLVLEATTRRQIPLLRVDPAPRAITSRRGTAAKRHRGFIALPQTSPTTTRAPGHQLNFAHRRHIDECYHVLDPAGDRAGPPLHPVYCPTEDMDADALTKALPSAEMKAFRRRSRTAGKPRGECCQMLVRYYGPDHHISTAAWTPQRGPWDT